MYQKEYPIFFWQKHNLTSDLMQGLFKINSRNIGSVNSNKKTKAYASRKHNVSEATVTGVLQNGCPDCSRHEYLSQIPFCPFQNFYNSYF